MRAVYQGVTLGLAALILTSCSGESAEDAEQQPAPNLTAGQTSEITDRASGSPTSSPTIKASREDVCEELVDAGEDSPAVQVTRLASSVVIRGDLSSDEIDTAYALKSDLDSLAQVAPPSMVKRIESLNEGPTLIVETLEGGGDSASFAVGDMFEASIDIIDVCAEGQEYEDLDRMLAGHIEAASEVAFPEDAPATSEASADVSPSASPEPTQLSEFGSGTFKVGDTVRPGTYVSESDVPLDGCYWERTDADGNIIDNNFIGSAFRVQVTIADGDYSFTSSKCGRWKMQ